MYCVLRARLLARLKALFTITFGYMQQDSVYPLAGDQFMRVVKSGRRSDIHGLVTVQLREVTRELPIVDIWTILGLANLIPERHWRWLVNSRID